MINTQAEFEKICEEAKSLRGKKNEDYGDAFLHAYNKYGDHALFFDLLRKWYRIENLLYNQKPSKVDDETIDQTLIDMGIMCFNAAICKRQKD